MHEGKTEVLLHINSLQFYHEILFRKKSFENKITSMRFRVFDFELHMYGQIEEHSRQGLEIVRFSAFQDIYEEMPYAVDMMKKKYPLKSQRLS